MLSLEVKKIKNAYCVVAGDSVLGRFKSDAKAVKSLKEDREFYKFWAGSAGVSIENTPAVIVNC